MRRSTALLLLGGAALTAASIFGSRPFVPIGFGLAAGVAARVWVVAVSRRVRITRSVPLERPLEGTTVRIVYRVEGVRPFLLGRAIAREQVERRGTGVDAHRRRGRARAAPGPARPVPQWPTPRWRSRIISGSSESSHGLRRSSRCSSTPGCRSCTHLLGRRQARRRPPESAAAVRGFDFHSVREYEDGESLRKVHWPTTAAGSADGEGASGGAEG